MSKVFVALSTFGKQGKEPIDLLYSSQNDIVFNDTGRRLTELELIELCKDCHGVIAGVEAYTAHVLESLPLLRVISRCGVGVDNIDFDYIHKRKIKVLNTPEVVVQPVAELTLAMLLDLLRHLTAHTSLLKGGRWEKLVGRELTGLKVGIVGLGRIGRRVAEILLKLNVSIYAYDVCWDESWARENGVHFMSLYDLLSSVDVVTLHLTRNSKEPFYLGQKEISMMKSGSMLINVARGGLTDEQALAIALKEGHLSAAAIDVFSQEPYKGPLCDLPNVILTPHIGTFTQESRLAMEVESVKNLLNALKSL